MWLWPSPSPLCPPTDPFVKVYLLQDGRKMSKKKTAVKRDDPNPVFNEAMIFSVPAIVLQVREELTGVGGGHHHGSGAAPSPPSSLLRAPVGGDGDAYVECPVVTSSMGAAGAQALLPVVFAGDGRESPNPLRACHTSAVRGGFCRKG